MKAPTSPAVTDTFLAQNIEVAAGVKQQFQADAKRLSGLRLLDGRFMLIEQAMGLPKGRDAGGRYVSALVKEMKASGFVAEALPVTRSKAPSSHHRSAGPRLQHKAPGAVLHAIWNIKHATLH